MTKTAGPELGGEPTLKGDAARQTLAEDEFGLGNMVAALAETLTKRINADGYVLGIEGRWGSGKSTFVNFIAEELKRTPEHVTAQVSQAGFNPAEAWRSGAGGLWSTLREGPNLASWLSRGASGSLRNRRRLARSGSHQRSSAAASSCARRVRPGCW